MFFLGIVGIFQALFFPGVLFISLIKFPKRSFVKFIAVVVSSLVLNYCLVLLLTTLHIYTRPVVFLLLFAEIVAIIWLNREAWNTSLGTYFDSFFSTVKGFVKKWVNFFRKSEDESTLKLLARIVYVGLCLILAYIALKWIVKLFLWNLGSTFNSYDTVAEWNKWAMDWAANMIPHSTWRYPQLLPTNWSIMYVIMGGTTLQFFAKSFMPLFTLFILLMMVDLGFQKKNTGYFLGAAIAYLTLKKFLGAFLIEGLADMPGAFLAFASVYFLMTFQDELKNNNTGEKRKEMSTVLIAFAAGGTAVTKQVGLEYLVFFSIIFLLFFVKPLIHVNKHDAAKIFWLGFSLVFLIVVPWYLYRQIQIWGGVEKSEVTMIISATDHAFQSTDIPTRFLNIIRTMDKYFYLFALIVPFSFFVDPLLRALNLCLALPMFVSWAIFASYDFRNFAIILPVFAMSSGLNIQLVVDWLFKLFRKISFEKVKVKYVIIALLILIFALGYFVFPADLLLAKHSEQVMQTFSTAINQKLVDALGDEEGEYTILTNYPLDYLPDLNCDKISTLFNDYYAYQNDIENSGVDYLLIPNYADQQILDDISQKISSGEYELIFEDDSWIPYQFVKVH